MKQILLVILILCVASSSFAGGKAMIFVYERSSYGPAFAAITASIISNHGGTYEVMSQDEEDDSIDVRIDSLAVNGFDLLILYCEEVGLLRNDGIGYDDNRRLISPSVNFDCPVPVLLCGKDLARYTSYSLGATIGAADADVLGSWSASVGSADWDSMLAYTSLGDTILNVNSVGIKLEPYAADWSGVPAGSALIHDLRAVHKEPGGEDVMLMWHWDGDTSSATNKDIIYYITSCRGHLTMMQTAAMLSVLRKTGVIDPVTVQSAMYDFGFCVRGKLDGDSDGDSLWANTDELFNWHKDNQKYIDVFGGFATVDADTVRTLGYMPDKMAEHDGTYVNFYWGEDNIWQNDGHSDIRSIFFDWGDDAGETTLSLYNMLVDNLAVFRSRGYADYMDATWWSFARQNYCGANTTDIDSILTCLAAIGVRNFPVFVFSNAYYTHANNVWITLLYPTEMTLPLDMVGLTGDTVAVNIWPCKERACIDDWALSTSTPVASPYHDDFDDGYMTVANNLNWLFRYLVLGIATSGRGPDGASAPFAMSNSELAWQLDSGYRGLGFYGHHFAVASNHAGANRGVNSFKETTRYIWHTLDAWNDLAGVTVFESTAKKNMSMEDKRP